MGRPRKTSMTVLLDTERQYTPNTIGSYGLAAIHGLSARPVFLRTVERLVNLQSIEPAPVPAILTCQVRLRFVVCNFLCRRYNIDPHWPLVDHMGKPLDKQTLRYIEALGLEATALFNLVTDLFDGLADTAGYSSAVELWAALMIENIPTQADLGSTSHQTKGAAILAYQKATAILTDRDSNRGTPFSKELHKRFFRQAIAVVDSTSGLADDLASSGSILNRSYKPYLAARANVARVIKKTLTIRLKNTH